MKLKYRTVVMIAVACVAAALLLFYLTFFAGNGKPSGGKAGETNPTVEQEEPAEQTGNASSPRPSMPTETPVEIDNTVYVNSKLTNLPVPEAAALRRPIAAVINNIYAALPQSGIAGAELIYETLAEGEITRLVGIFQTYGMPKLGPIRSARDYFVDFALDYDAIFIHHGGSPTGYAKLQNLRVDRLDGMTYEGVYFWRDRTYPSWDSRYGTQRPLVHSSYTGGEQIKEAAASIGFRTELYEDSAFGFAFYEGGAPVNLYRGSAETVSVPFSKDYTRVFEYNADTKLYNVFNRDGAHKDADTGKGLTVRNILVQLVDSHIIAGDEEGRRKVGTVGVGNGFIAHDGVYRAVTWRKNSADTPTEWFFADGSGMRLATGSTWVCVFQNNGEVVFK